MISIEIILILFVLIYLLFTAYLKYKLKFWISQPVFHIYNLWYWINPPGLIDPELPSIQSLTQKGGTKYFNQSNIKTLEVEKIKDDIICEHICNFIKTNYIFQSPEEKAKPENSFKTSYTPSKNNIIEYYKSTNHSAFFTIYQEPKILFEKGEAITTLKDIIGVIASRSLNITLKNKTFETYYVDNLCVDPLHRKSGIAPQLIQTHTYNLRHANKQIQTCLFKREGQLNALVPIVVFDTYCFDLTQFTVLKENITTIEITISQLSLFTDFVKSQMTFYTCIIMPDLTNLMNLLKTENIIIYGLLNSKGELIASYIFRYINLTYDGKKTIECISILLTKDEKNTSLYEKGYISALQKIREKHHFDYIFIENTANANCIIDHLKKIKVPIYFKSPTAFFLYNYAVRSLPNAELALIVY